MPVLGQAPAPQPAEGQLIAPPSWAYNDLACGPVSDVSKPVKKGDKQSKQAGAPVIPDLRIIGTQDTVTRQLLGPGDTLVVSGGSNAGLEPGQRYFVRRRIREQVSTDNGKAVPDNIHTSGWVQILGVDTMLATATVVHACDGIMRDDPAIREHGPHHQRLRRHANRWQRQPGDDRSWQQFGSGARPAILDFPG
jgi:hypothetical protein